MAKDASPSKAGLFKVAGAKSERAKMAADAAFERRAYTARGIAELIPNLTRAAYKKRSPAGALLMSDWSAIVGPRWALETQPRRLSGTQLTIACCGPAAVELQHISATLIERINTYAGQRLVDRLRFVQDFVSPPAAPVPARQVAPEPVDGVAEGPLNDALARLRATLASRIR